MVSALSQTQTTNANFVDLGADQQAKPIEAGLRALDTLSETIGTSAGAALNSGQVSPKSNAESTSKVVSISDPILGSSSSTDQSSSSGPTQHDASLMSQSGATSNNSLSQSSSTAVAETVKTSESTESQVATSNNGVLPTNQDPVPANSNSTQTPVTNATQTVVTPPAPAKGGCAIL